jgi:hypothetical protein
MKRNYFEMIQNSKHLTHFVEILECWNPGMLKSSLLLTIINCMRHYFQRWCLLSYLGKLGGLFVYFMFESVNHESSFIVCLAISLLCMFFSKHTNQYDSFLVNAPDWKRSTNDHGNNLFLMFLPHDCSTHVALI